MNQTISQLVAAIAKQTGWATTPSGTGIALVVPQSGGRTQSVRLSPFEYRGERLVRFSTTVGRTSELSAGRYEKALQVNYSMPHGHLAIDGNWLVLTETRPLDSATPESCAHLVRFIAKQADLYEQAIFKQDAH